MIQIRCNTADWIHLYGDDVVWITCIVHNGIGQVCKLFVIDARPLFAEISWLCLLLHVLLKGNPHVVNADLGVFHDVHIPKACRAVLFGEKHIKHKGIFPMVINAVLHAFLILRSIQQIPLAEFDQMQHHLRACTLFVVPVHHNGFFGSVNGAVVDILRRIQRPVASKPQIRIYFLQNIRIHQRNGKYISAVLDVRNPWLPEDVQHIHVPDFNVPQPIFLFRVPEHTENPGTVLQLIPPFVVVGLFKSVLFHDHRHDF